MGCARTAALWSLASLLLAAAMQADGQNLTDSQGKITETAQTIAGLFPASRAELQEEHAKVIVLEGVVNTLVREVNSLTPVATPSRPSQQQSSSQLACPAAFLMQPASPTWNQPWGYAACQKMLRYPMMA